MYQVLVVDDEAAHRKGIIQILNKMRPDYLILEAKDGRLAEVIMNSVKIDIVLTDIKMPNKDGLEFLKELRAKNDRAKVVIISGYGQFEYARKAMSLGAFDFLLKPLDIGELGNALTKVEKSIQTDREREQIKSEFNKVKHHYMDYLLNKQLRGNLTEEEEEQLHDVFKGLGAGFVFTIRTQTDCEQRYYDIKYMIKQNYNPVAHVITFEEQWDKQNLINFVFLKEASSFENCLEKIIVVRNYFNKELSETAHIGVSQLHNELSRDIRKACQQSMTALGYTFYSRDRVMYYNELKTDEATIIKLLRGKEADIVSMVEYGEEKHIEEQISELFARVETTKKPNPNRLKEIFVLITIRVILSLKGKYTIEEYEELVERYSRLITQSQTLWELKENLRSIYLRLNAIARNHEDKSENSIITRSIHYLEENYMEEISMERIAQKFYFSPSYFSVFFKNKTGVSFSQYITNLRIKNACRLLVDTNDKVNDICVKIGYSDPGYFGKVFKKKIGCSPDEYRKRNIKL